MSSPGPADVPEGLEGYPYASVEAERRIRTTTLLLSVIAVVMLLVGLYLALFTPRVGIGAMVTLIGFIDLMIVPFVAKRMRRAALAREAKDG